MLSLEKRLARGVCHSSLPTPETKFRLPTDTRGSRMRNNSQIKPGKSLRTVRHWNRDPERLQNLYPRRSETPN